VLRVDHLSQCDRRTYKSTFEGTGRRLVVGPYRHIAPNLLSACTNSFSHLKVAILLSGTALSMSCRKERLPIVCSWKAFVGRIRIERAQAMKSVKVTKFGTTLFLTLNFCLAVVAQGQRTDAALGTAIEASQISQTGTGVGSAGTTAAKSGKADGMGDPELGGERHPLYRLNRSDVVALSFTLSPELDQVLTVQPDGFVFLKDAGSLLACGLTLEEFRSAVRAAYSGYLHDPQIAVALKDFERPYFVAGGEVGHPGKYELRTETSILEAVQIAGGFTHEAKHSQVVLFRRVNDQLVEAHLFNLKQMLKEKSLNEIPSLSPGDLVFVPQNSISKIERFLTKPSMSMYVSPAQY
jgi:polysaccharide export outer membrane protein